MDLVVVAAFTRMTEAQLAKNLLEAEEIPAFLDDEMAGDMLHLTNEVKLMVASRDSDRAREVLAAVDRHELTRGAAAEGKEHSEDPAAE